MTDPRPTTHDDPDALRAFLDARIYEYNVATTGIHDGQLLALAVRDDAGAIIAGLSGWTWGGTLYIEYLWVHKAHRRDGYGTRLLHDAEMEAIGRGCTQSVLSTHAFQAPDFYPKHGYTVFGAVDEYPTGYQHIHFRKKLG